MYFARAEMDATWWPYKRLNGFSQIRRNDVVVFNHPDGGKNFYIKRCIGMPGKMIAFHNDQVYIGGKKSKHPATVLHKYTVRYRNTTKIKRILDSLHNRNAIQKMEDVNRIQLSLTTHEYEWLKNLEAVHSIRMVDSPIKITLGKDSIIWSANNWGPVVVPQKGKTITLTEQNWILYKKVMDKYEDAVLEKKGQVFLVNSKKATAYTFKHNYYFMLGDNRYNSIDSRYWGFVPEQHILGKAVMVLYSSEGGRLKWDRIAMCVK